MATETGHEMAAQAAEAAHGGTGATGMPQLDFSTFPNQIFWLIVTLLAIYFILSRVALPRISAVLAERNGTISNDLAAAEELRLRAAEAEAAYNKALADARADAQRIAAETRAEIKARLEAASAEAEADIAARTAESQARIAEIRDGALRSVEDVANEVTAEIVRAFGRPVDGSAVSAAVSAQLKGHA